MMSTALPCLPSVAPLGLLGARLTVLLPEANALSMMSTVTFLLVSLAAKLSTLTAAV